MSSRQTEQADANAALLPPPTSSDQGIKEGEPDSSASPELAAVATRVDGGDQLNPQKGEETPKDASSLQIEEETTKPTSSGESPRETSLEKEPLLPESPSDINNVEILPQPANNKSAEDSGAEPQPATASASAETEDNLNVKSSHKRRKRSRMATSLEDIGSLRLWKGIVAEFVGTLLLTLVGCGSCINLQGVENSTSPVVQIALCFGLSVATIVWAIAHVSGGHINPAVTAAMLATRKISVVKAVFFVAFQLIGAVVGAGILYGLTPQADHGNLGATLVSDKLSAGQGFGVELMITFVLVFTVFASCDGKRKDLNGSIPLTIGLSVTMCHLFAIDYTGSSMNTARSFGPAVVMGKWQHHWVYWAGPIVGGIAAGILYDMVFAVNASLTKAKACVLSSGYDDDKYHAQKIKVRIIEEDPEFDEGQELDEKKGDPSNA